MMMLADGSAEYAGKMGLTLDLTGRGMGVRATRFSLLVDDGVVEAVNVEENPGEAAASIAETVDTELLNVEDIQTLVRQVTEGPEVRKLIHERIEQMIEQQL